MDEAARIEDARLPFPATGTDRPLHRDFVSFRSRLIIEADGGQHGMPEGARSDQVRDAFLQSQGFRVLRFWNSDIDANLPGVMESILSALNPPPNRPSAGHPPHKGEG